MRPAAFLGLLSVSVLALSGCPSGGLGGCGVQADVTGTWSLQMTPTPVDGGLGESTIASDNNLTAQLAQHNSTNVFGIGKLIWGTIQSSDTSYFGPLTIPQLLNNNGSKTGEELNCTLKINVPEATMVTDDNTDQGPIRIALVGDVVAGGADAGGPHRVDGHPDQ